MMTYFKIETKKDEYSKWLANGHYKDEKLALRMAKDFFYLGYFDVRIAKVEKYENIILQGKEIETKLTK